MPKLRNHRCHGRASQTECCDKEHVAQCEKPACCETGVQAHSVEDFSPSFDELRQRLADNAAYKTLCCIGKDVYSEEVDQHLATHIDNLVRAEGEWLPIPSQHVFRLGDVVRMKHAFIPNQEMVEIRLKVGYRGIVNFIDEEGDAKTWFPDLLFAGLRGKHVGHWICSRTFQNIEMKGPTKDNPD